MAALVYIDSGPLVALLDRREEHHQWVVEQVTQIHPPVWTCSAVLSETCFLLASHSEAVAQLHGLIQRGILKGAEESGTLWDRAFGLMRRYANVPMSFADACLVALTEKQSAATIFTLDRDFLIYRGERDRPLVLTAPFAG